jgi:hypothetical protein
MNRRILACLAASAMLVIWLAGCSARTANQLQSDRAVTGTVTWPDGNPAANASIYFENRDLAACINNPNGFTGAGWSVGDSCNYFYQYLQLPAAGGGSYSLQGCPCANLTAYLYVPGAVMTQANGGSDCFIIMKNRPNNQNYQNYSGFQANPGDVIDWQALDLPCSNSWYASDPAAVQSVATQPPPFNSGPWQNAEQVTNGASGG